MSKEIVIVNLSARNRVQLSDTFQKACEKKTGSREFATLDLGTKLPDRFLMPDGPQPTLAELTVLGQKLGMQIQLSQVNVETFEAIEAKQAEAAKAAAKK